MFDGIPPPGLVPGGLDLDTAHPINRALVGWWPLIEGGGTLARDIGPFRSHGAYINSAASRTLTKYGRATTFASAAMVDAGKQSVDRINGQQSFSCWIIANSSGGGATGRIIDTNISLGQYVLIYYNGASGIAYFANGGSVVSSGSALTLGAIYHYVAVHSGTTISHYLNGIPANSGTTGTVPTAGSTQLYIGNRPFADRAWGGSIWNFRHFARAITAREVRDLYERPWIGAIEPTARLFHAVRLADSGAGTGVDATPGVGSIAVTGFPPSVAAGATASPGAGAVDISGFAPGVAAGALAAPSLGAIVLAGLAPGVAAGAAVAPGIGIVAITGLTPAAAAGATVAPAIGAVSVSGLAPSLSLGVVAGPGVGLIQLQGLAPTVSTRAQLLASASRTLRPGAGGALRARAGAITLRPSAAGALRGRADPS